MPTRAAARSATSTTPARSPRRLGIEHHVFNFGDDFDEHVVASVRGRPRRRPHAQPVHRVQPPPQVRPAAPAGRRARLRRGRHRPPRPDRGAGRRHPPRRPGRRPGQGPVLRRPRARPARAGPGALPGRRPHQGRRAGGGGARRAGDRRQARQPGRVLHHRQRGPGRLPRAAACPRTRARSSTRDGGRGRHGRTRSSSSRSASAAASGYPAAARLATSSTSTCRPPR